MQWNRVTPKLYMVEVELYKVIGTFRCLPPLLSVDKVVEADLETVLLFCLEKNIGKPTPWPDG